MKSLTVSFPLGGKTVSLASDLVPGEAVKDAVNALLAAADQLHPGKPSNAKISTGEKGKASLAQLRALYAKAAAAGWEKDRVKELLEKNLGVSSGREIIGKVDRDALSRVIDEVDAVAPDFGKATPSQLRVLWGKALGKGWDRERVKAFLQEKFSTSDEKQIIGHADRSLVSTVIDHLAAA